LKKQYLLPAGIFGCIGNASTAASYLIYQKMFKKLNWLEIYETELLPSDSDQYQNEFKHKFWKRVRVTYKLTLVTLVYTSIVYPIFFSFMTFKSVPYEYHLPYTILNSIHVGISCIGVLVTLVTSITIFYHVCYHLSLRFDYVNNTINDLSIDLISEKNFNRRLMRKLREHNQICIDLSRYNHFWKIYLALNYLFHPIVTMLFLYVAIIPAQVDFVTKVCFGFASLLVLTCLSCPCLSAGVVQKKV